MDKKKNIFVPFRSITSFTDPSIGFSLQFKIDQPIKLLSDGNNIQKNESSKISEVNLEKETKSGEVVSLDEFRDKK